MDITENYPTWKVIQFLKNHGFRISLDGDDYLALFEQVYKNGIYKKRIVFPAEDTELKSILIKLLLNQAGIDIETFLHEIILIK